MRPLISLMMLVLTLAVSGISSAAISTSTGDDCCADGKATSETESGAAELEHSDGDDHPAGDRDTCPPLCHKCACSPMFAVPMTASAGAVTLSLDSWITFANPSRLPLGPPGAGVFHPPRRTA